MDKHSILGLSARYEKLNQKQDLLVRLNQVSKIVGWVKQRGTQRPQTITSN
jgi:hypothetical protein